MARSWLKYVAILASLVAGTVCSTALADNKGMKFSGGARVSGGGSPGGSFSRGSAGSRPSGNFGGGSGQVFKAPTRVTGNSGGSFGGQVLNKTGGNVLTKPPVLVGPKPPVFTPKLPIGGGGNGGGIKINPTPIGGIAGGGLKINPIGGGKLGGISIGPKLPINPVGPVVGPKLSPGIAAGGCFPGGHPHVSHCNPFKPGCHPWWFCPSWVAPAHCQPVVYTEPIIVPVSVPAAPIFVPVAVESSPVAPAEATTPAATETAKPATTTLEEKLLQVPLGATLTLQAKELGEQAGQVIVQIDKIAMPALISDWKTESVTVTLPTVAIAENLRAELMLVKADGQIASSVKIELTPALPPVAEDAKLAGDPAAALLPASLNP